MSTESFALYQHLEERLARKLLLQARKLLLQV